MKKTIITLLLIFLPIYAHASPVDKRIQILQIIDQSNSINETMADTLLYSAMIDLEQKHPEATELEKAQYKEIMFNVIQATLKEQPLDLSSIVDVYDKYFTENEIKTIAEFYKSPTGVKFNNVLPAMMKDILKSTAEWQNELKPQMIKNLEKALRDYQ